MASKQILNQRQIDHRLTRMAYEVYEAHYHEHEVILAGIPRKGYELAKKLQEKVASISAIQFKLAKLHFDKRNPIESYPELDLPLSEVSQRSVILIDDVINTGETLFYATKPFHQLKLKQLKVLVLVNRDHTAFPFQPDYTGLSLATTLQERITVKLNEAEEAVYLV
jgi:pyrimidine operon attenuation protein/uracil phosphoribosyltransferase